MIKALMYIGYFMLLIAAIALAPVLFLILMVIVVVSWLIR
jgi:hypothetical protein